MRLKVARGNDSLGSVRPTECYETLLYVRVRHCAVKQMFVKLQWLIPGAGLQGFSVNSPWTAAVSQILISGMLYVFVYSRCKCYCSACGDFFPVNSVCVSNDLCSVLLFITF